MAEDEALRRSETVFIDNLPQGIWKVWLFNFFSKFGKIQSIHVPIKKSKTTGNKFCFVRFEHDLLAQRVVKVVNGLWLWGKTLVANIARFSTSNNGRKQNLSKVWRPTTTKEGMGKKTAQLWRKKENPRDKQEQNNSSWVKNLPPIKVKELGNGWLYRSAIAKISSTKSVVRIQDQLMSLGQSHVLVRYMGGDMVVLTFKDSEERDTMFNEGKMAWLKEWFVESSKWEDTMLNPCSRLVWINCYGIPLHLWNNHTFSEIGRNWGDVIMIAEDTIKKVSFAVGKILISTTIMDSINKVVELENNGKLIKIRIMEEQLVVNTVLRTDCACLGCQMEASPRGKSGNNHSMQPNAKEDEGGGIRPRTTMDEEEAESTSSPIAEVAESTSCPAVVAAKPISPPIEVVTEPTHPTLVAEPSLLGPYHTLADEPLGSVNINTMQVVPYKGSNRLEQDTRGSRIVQHYAHEGRSLVTPYLDALMSNLKLPKPHISPLKVNSFLPLIPNYISQDPQKVVSVPTENQPEASSSTNNLAQVAALLEENTNNKDKTKRKLRSIEDVLGLSKPSRSRRGRRAKQKCVVFRSAMAAAAISVSSEGIMNRNKILLSESKAAWSITKILGTDFMGDDEEVISKIMVTEEEAEQGSTLQAQSH